MRNAGLVWFVAVVVVTVFALLTDSLAAIEGRPTITAVCRDHPVLAWAILAVLFSGIIGLAIHFRNHP
jgi:hypothetical protein